MQWGLLELPAAAPAFHRKFVYPVSMDKMTGKPNTLCDQKQNKTQSYNNKINMCHYNAKHSANTVPNINYSSFKE